ncbi:type III effector protein [Streptomyces sp. ISL-36]|uniref:type III effector protein n=1 Tax=Streptomyces sp. ISL-36 TaxID=2819182 RepID=UPI001BE5D628|nr:type III effector protein [Streptomyces sp. ISL-36]MBT2443759.1 type III effector protein [Streptomyces sp. ISL-36]
MTASDQSREGRRSDRRGPGARVRTGPESFLAAAAALDTIDAALRAVHAADPDVPTAVADTSGPEQALASLLLLRQVRDELGSWESTLIEAAREAGASWADLAHPLGVASRQAAERRYLRLRPGADGTTAEQRVKATRDRRAADRAVVTWARDHAADLRRLAGQITALTDLPGLPDGARAPLAELDRALADNDAAALVDPLADTRDHLRAARPDLAENVDRLVHEADRLRRDSTAQRGTP